MNFRRGISLGLVGLLAALGGASALGDPAPGWLEPFQQDPWLRTQTEFWKSIYSRHTSEVALLHDSVDVTRIYEEIRLHGCSGQCRRLRYRTARARWRKALLALDRREQATSPGATARPLSQDEQRVWDLFSGEQDRNRFARALRKKRMRIQLGQRDRFAQALESSRGILPRLEAIFREEGVPVELTRIPFVESSFNPKALSKVGAAGIWQLMPTTASQYLRVDESLDQRTDLEAATRAAARLLRDNYRETGSWALAVVAYNHGRKGMLRAVRQVGSTDVRDVVRQFRGRSFGFASRNFFLEFLAAYEVEQNQQRYFGGS